jgi:glycosyltransferase involved in cell wall biosynthesis
MPAVSVIVPARNAAATLPRTLAALREQDIEGDFEVLVVDDGSHDATAKLAERAGDQVRVLRQAARGPAQARNAGASVAAADVLAFTDADCYPEPGWLRAGLACMEHADFVQGAVRPDPDASVGPFDRTLWVEKEVGLYESANLFVRRSVFEVVGGFEEWMQPAVGKAMAEDVWFGWKIRRRGASVRFCPDALVHHAVFQRGPVGYVAERRRLLHFPEIAAKMPEIRSTLFFSRVFLSSRTAAFDLAVAGVGLAVGRRSGWPLLLSAPYARALWRRHHFRGPKRAALAAAADVAAELVGLGALVAGSVRARSLVL